MEHFSTGHEQTQYNRVCYFHLLCVFLVSKGSNLSELISKSMTCNNPVAFILSAIGLIHKQNSNDENLPV